MNIFLLPHLGLGDQFIMNGYVHYLLDTFPEIQEICIVAKSFTHSTLKHLYSDYSKITFYLIEEKDEATGSTWYTTDALLKQLNRAPFGIQFKYNEKIYILHNFGCHSSLPFHIHKTNWADAFYQQANVDPKLRLDFRFPSHMNKSKELYSRVIESIQSTKYILLHEDTTRLKSLNKVVVRQILKENNTLDLPVLYLGRNRYNYPLHETLNNKGSNDLLQVDSILEYTDLIKNATECHFIDSSIGVLTDSIEGITAKLYDHLYVTCEAPGYASSQKINTKQNWNYITTDDVSKYQLV